MRRVRARRERERERGSERAKARESEREGERGTEEEGQGGEEEAERQRQQAQEVRGWPHLHALGGCCSGLSRRLAFGSWVELESRSPFGVSSSRGSAGAHLLSLAVFINSRVFWGVQPDRLPSEVGTCKTVKAKCLVKPPRELPPYFRPWRSFEPPPTALLVKSPICAVFH